MGDSRLRSAKIKKKFTGKAQSTLPGQKAPRTGRKDKGTRPPNSTSARISHSDKSGRD